MSTRGRRSFANRDGGPPIDTRGIRSRRVRRILEASDDPGRTTRTGPEPYDPRFELVQVVLIGVGLLGFALFPLTLRTWAWWDKRWLAGIALVLGAAVVWGRNAPGPRWFARLPSGLRWFYASLAAGVLAFVAVPTVVTLLRTIGVMG